MLIDENKEWESEWDGGVSDIQGPRRVGSMLAAL